MITLPFLLTFPTLQFILWLLTAPVFDPLGWSRAVGAAGQGAPGTHLALAWPPPISPIPDSTRPNAWGALGSVLPPRLLMFVMISLTGIQDDTLGADVCNLLAGGLDWRSGDIWHQVQPTTLSRSGEGESRGRKGNFWSHHLRVEETGRLWAASSASAMGSACGGLSFHLLTVCRSLPKKKDV